MRVCVCVCVCGVWCVSVCVCVCIMCVREHVFGAAARWCSCHGRVDSSPGSLRMEPGGLRALLKNLNKPRFPHCPPERKWEGERHTFLWAFMAQNLPKCYYNSFFLNFISILGNLTSVQTMHDEKMLKRWNCVISFEYVCVCVCVCVAAYMW